MKSNVRPWYKKFGPISWYRNEWVSLDLTIGSRILLCMILKPWIYFEVVIGGKGIKRSLYGKPCNLEPYWHFRIGEVIGGSHDH